MSILDDLKKEAKRHTIKFVRRKMKKWEYVYRGKRIDLS